MKKIYVFIGLLFMQTMLLKGQDLHFSQFYYSPLNLNPALTGSIDGQLRGVLNYRNQWRGITTPYETFSFSADMTLLGDELGEDWIGVGVVFVKDKAGQVGNFLSGTLTDTKFMLSSSYFKWLNKWNYLSFGLQAGILQRRLDNSEFTFDNQWTGNSFDKDNIDSKELFLSNNFTVLDVQAGLLWSFIPTKNITVKSGIGLFHLLKPQNFFLAEGSEDKGSRLSRKAVIHSSAKIDLNKQMILLPSALYMRQQTAQEITVGTALGYKIVEDYKYDITTIVYAGSWYRFGDAVVIMVGGEYQNFILGLSYDINVSSLFVASKGKGGPELSLIYEAPIPTKRRRRAVKCPRFR